MTPALSIVVPTLDEAARLPSFLDTLKRHIRPEAEIVIADGGSRDGTREQAIAAGVRLVTSKPGRGTQLAAGAAAATGEWLLFLHADTLPDAEFGAAIERYIARDGATARAGYCRFRLDERSPMARLVEAGAALRTRLLALPYGDQGLLIHRDLYRTIGGYKLLPLMEDVDIARRLGRRRLAPLGAVLVSSARRYRRDGYWRRIARNLACLLLFHLGVAPARIARFYR